ncbi:epidermal differentiation-specific protein-like [Colossoma macropomum]|uniref:epidermal differentiation-specific protein-like n=1 Tax=Colossoma macropomum TaxID=42526 RepID=UPI001863D468|nr:epidermal differentiation-specific protein-like [Colossoma macropomum]XP_036447379.1 epidermal differentiation-specific protein-like [Colossoma macropomum]
MSKIIVFENPNFGGRSKEFTSSVPNLIKENFNDCISSLRVIGNPWLAYSDVNYRGSQFVYEEGDYATMECNDSFSSLEMVTEDLTNPQITLYEDVNYGGRSIVLTGETNLVHISFQDVASSHKVQKGVWVLYEESNRRGAQMVARASRDLPDYGSFNKKASHVRPLMPGIRSIKAEINWKKKEERVRPVTIDSICGLNQGEQEKSFSNELIKEYEGFITDSFSFSSPTQIPWGMSFSVDVGAMKADKNFSLSETFTVEKGSSNTRTEKKSIRVSLPTKIAPHTKLTVNVVRKEVNTKALVMLTIMRGSQAIVEFGEYRCQSGISITTECKEEKI